MSRYNVNMTKQCSYHHGNLRSALIEAGAALLDEVGWSGLTLRACAARAGVSHAAPAHHFGSLIGLRTALAAEAFRRFHEITAEYTEQAGESRSARLRAAGRGYIAFARANPGLFQLMFGPAELDQQDYNFNEARSAAYEQLGDNVAGYLGLDDNSATDSQLRLAVWSSIHGYTQLLLSGHLNKPDMVVSEEMFLDDVILIAERYALR